jgi:hypothetical protein
LSCLSTYKYGSSEHRLQSTALKSKGNIYSTITVCLRHHSTIYSSFAAMSLSNLPREILLNIAEPLGDAGINALSCTNSQLYGLLNKFFYSRDMRSQSRSLLWAAKNGVKATVQLALAAGGNLDFIPESYHLALQAAAIRGYIHLVQLLLEVEGINPNFEGGWRQCDVPPLFSLLKGTILPLWNCSLLTPILIRILENGTLTRRHYSRPAGKETHLS